MYQSYKMDLAGRPLVVDINRVGKQANGCAFMHYGDTTVLCTATASEKPRDGIDFFPLSVEYEEKMYAVGKIPGGFNKREGKASEHAILTSRVIDRPMRPLFPKDYRNDVTLNNMVMSVDPECRPELVAMIGAAIATCISDIPFDGPCAMTQVGMIDGEFIINPSQEQWKKGDLNLTVDRYKNEYPEMIWTSTFPLIRDAGKCIKCMRCVQICDKIQTLNIWDVSGTGSHTTVDVSHNLEIKESDCSLCGQCVTHCPTAALQERDDVEAINGIHGELANDDKVTVAVVAPAVRAAWGEEFGLSPEFATDRRLVSTLKSVGFDYVFDVDFAADLTIMEESNELLARLQQPDKYSWPMFTSCCPGWVSFAKSQYPELLPQLSTAKSPQQMFGAVIKTYFAQKKGIAPENITCVSIMPCMSKKRELTLPGMDSAGTGQDIDYVLTTREICRLIKADHIDVSRLLECDFDDPLGEATGAGVIFGASGGVLEAALRTAYHTVTGENPEIGEQSPLKVLRQIGSFKELEIDIKGVKLHCAALSSLGEARRLIQAMKRGECHYDFVEVMACPGGCVAGAGTIQTVKKAAAALEKMKKEASFTDAYDSKYRARLESLEKFDVE